MGEEREGERKGKEMRDGLREEPGGKKIRVKRGRGREEKEKKN